MNNELYHFGIKGMKWGVRRYQNPDGSLTEAGRKRYLHDDGSLTENGTRTFFTSNGDLTAVGKKAFISPNGSLTKTGRSIFYDSDGYLSNDGDEFNKNRDAAFNRYKDATLYNVARVYPQFSDEVKRFQTLQSQANTNGKKAINDWLTKKDYKGLSYYQFKEAYRDRFAKSNLANDIQTSRNKIRAMVDETAKGHPLYEKRYTRLKDFNSNAFDQQHNIPMTSGMKDFESVDYGKQVVDSILSELMRIED